MEDLRVAKAFLAKVSAYGRQRALRHQAVSENASETVQAAAAPAFDSPSTMRTVRLQVSTCHVHLPSSSSPSLVSRAGLRWKPVLDNLVVDTMPIIVLAVAGLSCHGCESR